MAIDTEKLIEPCRVPTHGKVHFPEGFSTTYDGPLTKQQARAELKAGLKRLQACQEMLYAQDTYSLLVILQAMDAAGKDSTIEHVMSGVNPQGCQVFSFKQPSAEELDHDFLWRAHRALPERGRIGIFNRSYYEETLVVRVHPELLARQRLPDASPTEKFWRRRFDDINHFERYLTENGTVVVKIYLHVSKKEQKERFLERINEPEKHWKFSAGDVRERARWGDYMAAYADVFRHTSTDHAPWYVVPADRKWFTRLTVAAILVSALRGLDLHYPKLSEEHMRELDDARRQLEREED